MTSVCFRIPSILDSVEYSTGFVSRCSPKHPQISERKVNAKVMLNILTYPCLPVVIRVQFRNLYSMHIGFNTELSVFMEDLGKQNSGQSLLEVKVVDAGNPSQELPKQMVLRNLQVLQSRSSCNSQEF